MPPYGFKSVGHGDEAYQECYTIARTVVKVLKNYSAQAGWVPVGFGSSGLK